ncbi:hypothetical protein L226DRAFT_77168 [Lentinus tigrinus ALCF2SS1-7]|uniref:uncharacterized protein n=1 Tax=Lentinus tigrinus ALCF2SS1-7 TaxID=1328758 RepID=UPI0011660639|nr:hypothetical protein L226DRAFT_77168 [Lentinus tigrinus ALCF2SS1-7]
MADALKDQGNKAFQAKDYDKAIELFSQALELDPNNFVLWSNRSAAKAGKRQWAGLRTQGCSSARRAEIRRGYRGVRDRSEDRG